MPQTLTAVMVVAGPSSGLSASLARARAVADEVVVLDLSREGDSAARDDEVRVITASRADGRNVAEAYHYAMAHATNEWVLLLQPDEWIGDGFEQAWEAFDGATDTASVVVTQASMGRPLRGDGRGPRRASRLMRRTVGLEVTKSARLSTVEISVRVATTSAHLDVEFVNDPLGDVDAFLRARDLESDWMRRAETHCASLPRLVTAAPSAFIRSYAAAGGWRDGVVGFFLACLVAASSFAHEMKCWVDEQPPTQA